MKEPANDGAGGLIEFGGSAICKVGAYQRDQLSEFPVVAGVASHLDDQLIETDVRVVHLTSKPEPKVASFPVPIERCQLLLEQCGSIATHEDGVGRADGNAYLS